MSKIKIFTSPNCLWCKKVKEYLERRGIPFEEIDKGEDRRAPRFLTYGIP